MSKVGSNRGEDLLQHRCEDSPLARIQRGEGITKNIAAAVQYPRGRGRSLLREDDRDRPMIAASLSLRVTVRYQLIHDTHGGGLAAAKWLLQLLDP